jgi:hypothetical protein
MRQSIALTITAALALAIAAVTSPAAAGKKKTELETDGYKCERVSVNFIECTKEGSPTYWCDDAGTCQAKRPKPKFDAGGGQVVKPKSNEAPADPKGSQSPVTAPKSNQ